MEKTATIIESQLQPRIQQLCHHEIRESTAAQMEINREKELMLKHLLQ